MGKTANLDKVSPRELTVAGDTSGYKTYMMDVKIVLWYSIIRRGERLSQ
jgi:hypothetical protein